jgi:uncharacterized phage protein (TIGR02218 family)
VRALSPTLVESAGEEVTHLGWLLAVFPVGLPNVFLNTFGTDFDYDSNTYLADPGFVMGAVRVTDGTDPATLSVVIPVSDDGPVTLDNVTQGLYRSAVVVVRVVDYVTGDVSPPIGFKWSIGDILITNDGTASFEIRAETRVRRELVLKIFEAQCPYHLGDARCGVDMAPFTDAVTVDSVTSLYEFTVTGSIRADGYFENGAIRFNTGTNTGLAYTVRRWTLSTRKLLLWEPLRAPAQIGDTASVHAGDDKSRGAGGCTKFNNITRFGGFADMPTTDVIFQHPDLMTEETIVETEIATEEWYQGSTALRDWWMSLASRD